MPIDTASKTLFYPNLGSEHDLWYVRISGSGIGNCFYNYFHAAVLAEKYKGDLISPPWFTLKLGPIIRRERSKRFYWRMFKPYPGEISGAKKFLALLSAFPGRHTAYIDVNSEPVVQTGRLNYVTCKKFFFHGLHEYRDMIRTRLLGILQAPAPEGHSWGKGGFIGVHIRLSDFTVVADPNKIAGGFPNARIPLSWYETVILALQARYPDLPIRIFSDGQDWELQPLLALGASVYRSGSDINDLLAMSSASILVGSNSTYSRWATFLGDMPSIWLDMQHRDEKPSAADTPILFIPIDATKPVLWP